VLPLVALLMLVLTGFAALAIDGGVAYDQSRTGQDASDAAALAASYYLFANPSGTLQGAYTAAQNVAGADCTGPSAPCTVTLNFYGSSWTGSNPGTPVCSAASSSAGCLSGSASTAAYVGVSIGSVHHDYFANLDPSGSRSFGIGNQAVAQVRGGSGGGSGQEYLSCVLCVLARQGGTGLSIPSTADGLNMFTSGANIDINGGMDCEGSGNAVTIDTTTGGGWGWGGGGNPGVADIAGSYTDHCVLTWNPSSNPVTPTSPIPDPLAGLQMPSPTYYSTCNTGTLTITTTETIQPGCYNQIVIDSPGTGGWGGWGGGGGSGGCPAPGSGIDVTFASGLYIIYGGLTIEGNGTTVTSQYCYSAQSGDTLYFTCANGAGTGPAACAGGGQVGAGLTMNVSGSYQWNLFPPTTGPWANLVVMYDRNNTADLITATQNSDPDSDHNGAIYAASGTYVTENYTASGPSITTGNSQATALGSPIVVDYMDLDANYGSGGGWYDWGGATFQLNNDVTLPAGGPGGLVQ
jgi:Flp pilus assembly protein TadG